MESAIRRRGVEAVVANRFRKTEGVCRRGNPLRVVNVLGRGSERREVLFNCADVDEAVDGGDVRYTADVVFESPKVSKVLAALQNSEPPALLAGAGARVQPSKPCRDGERGESPVGPPTLSTINISQHSNLAVSKTAFALSCRLLCLQAWVGC